VATTLSDTEKEVNKLHWLDSILLSLLCLFFAGQEGGKNKTRRVKVIILCVFCIGVGLGILQNA